MARLPHLLGRLDFDVAVENLDLAMRLRPRLENLVWERVPAVMERVFDALDPAGMVLILDRLDLDLGMVGEETLEADTLEALAPALAEALENALNAVRFNPLPGRRLATASALQLDRFGAYLTSGVLPFAGRGNRLDPPAVLRALIDAEPAALVALLRRHASNSRVIERLVLQAEPGGLHRLLGLLAPSDALTIIELLTDLRLTHRESVAASKIPASEARLEHLWWVTSLEFLLHDAGSQFNRRRFLAHLLRREAERLGIDYQTLLEMLEAALARVRTHMGLRSSLPVVLNELLGEHAAPRAGGIDALLAEARRRADDPTALEALAAGLPPALFAELLRRIEPAGGDTALGLLEELSALQAAIAPDAGLAREIASRLRTATLHHLLNAGASSFGRHAFLDRLLSEAMRDSHWAQPDRLREAAAGRRGDFRSALPALLADLAPPPAEPPPPSDGMEEALTAVQRGNSAPLSALLRRAYAGGGRAAVGPIADRLPAAAFSMALRDLVPAQATALLADLDGLAARHGTSPLVLLGEAGFARLLRRAALVLALGEAPFPAAAEARLAAIIDFLAAATGASPAALRLDLARESSAEGDDRPARDGDAAALLRLAAQHPARLMRVVAAIEPDRRGRLLAELDPAHAGIIGEDLTELTRLHGAVPLLPVGAGRFGEMLSTLALLYLAERRGTRFDRKAFGRFLLRGIARYGGVAPAQLELALWQGVAGTAAPSSAIRDMAAGLAREFSGGAAPGNGEQLRALGHFLRTGHPRTAGRGLALLAERDPARLAALVHRLTQESPGKLPEIVGRLLDWLLPDELLTSLAPGSAGRALRWAEATGLRGAAAWSALVRTVMTDETPEFDLPPAAFGRRLDRLALIGHWLDRGELAWWAPPETSLAGLLSDIADLSSADLSWLFATGDLRRTTERLRRALDRLDRGPADALLARLVPAASTGLLASLAPGPRRRTVLMRAAAAMLEGSRLDLARLVADETETVPAAPPPPPTSPPREADPAALFAWLDGARARGSAPDALARLFVRLADAGDAALIDHLRSRLRDARSRARWAASLPPEALGRLVRLLRPAGGQEFVETAMLLGTAWRRTLPFGAARPEASRIWAILLDLLAEPEMSLPRLTAEIIAAATANDEGRAAALEAEARQLARHGGHVAVLAALHRASSASGTEKRSPPSRPAAEPDPPPAPAPEPEPLEPDRKIYVGNAGLVLLSPYLPALFQRLQLLSEDEGGKPGIRGLERQSRAVHLLQYLVDGHLDRTEPELALNKLLCGLATAVPIEPSITAPQKDLDICEGLLGAVIENWPLIKNSSIAALRETFLQREGRLVYFDGKWQLLVQRKGVDVLVDRIPWSFGTVFHRWMAEPVQVTW